MRIIRIIAQIGILYFFYYVGVFLVKITHLPLPASIIGLLLLVGCLQMKWIKIEYIRDGAGLLLGSMTLFFIPAMLGIIDYPELLSMNGLILIASVIVSTLMTIYIAGIISQKIEQKELKMKEKKEGKEGKVIEGSHLHH